MSFKSKFINQLYVHLKTKVQMSQLKAVWQLLIATLGGHTRSKYSRAEISRA